NNDPNLSPRAAAEVGEIIRVSRDADHRRVNFVEGPFLIGSSVTDRRAGAQANHGDAWRLRLRIKQLEDLPQRSGAMIISQRFALARRINKLGAVQRVAVNKIAKRTRLTLGHPRHAKEIPFHVQRLAVWSKVEPATDQDSRRPQAKSYRPVHECKTSNGRQTDHEPVSQIDRLKFGEGNQNGQDRGKNAKQG